MILYITIMVVAVAIANRIQPSSGQDNYIERGGKRYRNLTRQDVVNRVCMLTLLAMLFIASALRINTGNDYRTYISHFHDIVCGNYVVTEKGFNLVVTSVYRFLGEENYLVVFAIFAFFTILFFMLAIYEQSIDFQLSFFLFITLGLYFQTYNTVRYYFALSLVLYSMKFVNRGEYLKFVLIILFTSLFHKSALIVLPIFFLARVPWKKWQVGIITALAITGLFFESFYMQILLRLYPSYLNSSELTEGSSLSLTNIARCLAVLFFAVYIYYRNGGIQDKEYWFYFYLNFFALLLYTCFRFVPFVSRIGYYMNVSHLFYLPLLIKYAPSGKAKMFGKGLILTAGLLYFFVFLSKAGAINVRILPYSSWLNADLVFDQLTGK